MLSKFALGTVVVSALCMACGSSSSSADGAAGSAQTSAGTSAQQGGASAQNGGTTGSGASGAGTGGSSNGHAGSSATGGAGSSNGGGAAGQPSSGGNAGAGSNAGSGTGGMPAAAPFKGLAFNLNGSSCDDLKTLGLSWYYAWSGSAPCPGTEFVPQIWGSWKKLNWVPTPAKAVSKGAKHLLGFNEPDGTGQANMTVDEAIGLWPELDQPGVLLGSPAVAGVGWLPDFMTQAAAKNLRVDFIAMHWYGWEAGSCNNVTALEGKIQWAEQWQRPIWITEWSCRLQSAPVNQKFFSDALVMLKKHPLVQRYAWFLSRSTGEFVNAALLDNTGKPTTLGSEYIAAPATR